MLYVVSIFYIYPQSVVLKLLKHHHKGHHKGLRLLLLLPEKKPPLALRELYLNIYLDIIPHEQITMAGTWNERAEGASEKPQRKLYCLILKKLLC